MSLLLTVYGAPAWETFVSVSGLPLITDAPVASTSEPAILQPVHLLSNLPALLSILEAEQSLWLAVVQAEYFFADAIENGIALAAAAEQWEQQTTELLSLHRQHRRQLQLFNLQQALAQPAVFSDNLRPTVKISDYQPQSPSNSLALLAACQYIAQQPKLKVLNTRLQASVISLCESEALVLDVDQIFQRCNATATQSTAVSDERDLIILQLQKTQEQLERQEQANAIQLAAIADEREHLQQKLTGMQQQMNKATAECHQLQLKQKQHEASLASTSEERDLILLQLQKLQEQLEQSCLELETEQNSNRHTIIARDKQQARELSKLQSDLRKAQARAASAEYADQLLEKELARLQSSISWKAATPVRVLGRLVKKTDTANEKLIQETALLLTSEYFDVDWYLRIYPDVAESKMNPAEHYLLYGAAEGRVPGPLFDGNWYLQHYPDVAIGGINPLLHFIMFGQQEGRSSSPKLLTNDNHNAGE